MSFVKKLGYGFLSLVTLFFYTVSNGFPKNRILNSIRAKALKIQENDASAPQNLILEQQDNSSYNEYAGHTSHSSHRSHASHKSGTGGTPVSKRPTPKPTSTSPGVEANFYEQYLSVADVERITGKSGIQRVTEPLILHFYVADGREILRIQFRGRKYFDYQKNESKYGSLKGIGEAALIGTPQLPIQLIFVKGKNCIDITTFSEEGLNLFLSLEQLEAVASSIASRL